MAKEFSAPVVKNGEYTVEIESVTGEGSGVCHIDGFAVFVPQTAAGDTARILIVKVRSGYGYGKLLKILTPSPERVAPVCPAYKRCGGCQLMHIDYGAQLRIKESSVKDALSRIGGVSDFDFEGITGMETPYAYRNKMVFPIGERADGGVCAGFYASRSHDIIPLNGCVLGNDICTHIISAVGEYAAECGVSAYDEARHDGVLRRIFVRSSKSTSEHMVIISANADSLPRADVLVQKLTCSHPQITGVLLNINKKQTNLVLGDKNVLLYGKAKLTDTVCGNTFDISPHSFFQVNPEQTQKLYDTALDYADIKESDTVMDIYCGIGTISLACARRAARVTGVEIVPQAIRDAKANAEANGIKNADFYAADAADIVPRLIADGSRPDIVILDPPRKGSDEKTLTAIINAAPKRIVYVSCNPATLARDIKFLEQNNYKVKRVKAVDMFPHTSHVETVMLLQRQDM